MSTESYPVCLDLRLDWSEMDLFGHINNVAFMKYIQASRVHYWEQIGLNQYHRDTNTGPILASTACQFKKPLYFPGTIKLFSKMAFIKNSSFSIHHLIVDAQGDIAAEAQDVMVMFDFNNHEKIVFPESLRQRVETLEQKTFNRDTEKLP